MSLEPPKDEAMEQLAVIPMDGQAVSMRNKGVLRSTLGFTAQVN